MSDSGNAPSWLFSFVDLAFLLLISMTQLAHDAPGTDLGDIVVPRIEQSATQRVTGDHDPPWQLRIHPPQDATPPFELVREPRREGAGGGPRLSLAELRRRLQAIKAAGGKRPLLAPHEDSRSQDLLDAVAALENQWPGRRRAVVSPIVATR